MRADADESQPRAHSFMILPMQKNLLRSFIWMMAAVVMSSFTLLAADYPGQTQPKPISKQTDSLKMFLRDYAGNPSSSGDKATHYSFAFVDLKDDGTQEAIVYLTGDGWCGSGGCTTLILAPSDSSYRVVTKITISRPPIRILASKSNGWHDISVRVQGGGIVQAYEARLPFNGKTYPSNPSTLPAQRLVGRAPGEVVIPLTRDEMPLY